MFNAFIIHVHCSPLPYSSSSKSRQIGRHVVGHRGSARFAIEYAMHMIFSRIHFIPRCSNALNSLLGVMFRRAPLHTMTHTDFLFASAMPLLAFATLIGKKEICVCH